MSDKTHGSTGGNLRPRQRTFTSCTECRRRKQKCNQAKDRPCNNCSRRYPPVVCSYQSSSPTPPPHDHIVDLHEESDTAHQSNQSGYQASGGRTNMVPNPAYISTAGASQYYSGHTTAGSSTQYAGSHGYYSSPTMSTDYQSYQTQGSDSQHIATSSSSDFVPMAGGYYPTDQMSFSSPEQPHDAAFYPTSDQQGDWLSSSGDASNFVGTSDYYYVSDEPEHSRSANQRH